MDHIPDEVRDDLESRPNVVGTARGRKRVGDRPTDEDAVIVLVNRKLPDAQLADGDRVPETVEVEGETVKTDVQEVGDVRTQATVQPGEGGERRPNRKRRWRPAPAGVSVGHPTISAGTMGTPPLETADGTTVTLTNRHVAAPVGEADVGDDLLQPGPADGGTADSDVGDLKDWSEVTKEVPNRSDSAIVEVDDDTIADYVLGIGPLAGWTGVERDATYTKSGRTTGVTTGELRARDARIRVNGYYDTPTVFEGVDVFAPMSAGGDSGSIIGIERDDGFYGTNLLFAGSDRSTIGIPMDTVQGVHGELTPIHPEGGENGGSGGGGAGSGDGGPDDPTAGFRGRVEDRLREVYGGRVAADGEADFRVDAWPVTLSVHVATSAEAALTAVGPALVAADDAHPVIVYPASTAADGVEGVDAVSMVPLSADGSADGG